jgi:hypothetical protein
MSRITAAAVAAEIANARLLMIEKEGWGCEDDNTYTEGQLADAAACYTVSESHRFGMLSNVWPWSIRFSRLERCSSRREELMIAAALIVAEVERLDRASKAKGEETVPAAPSRGDKPRFEPIPTAKGSTWDQELHTATSCPHCGGTGRALAGSMSPFCCPHCLGTGGGAGHL